MSFNEIITVTACSLDELVNLSGMLRRAFPTYTKKQRADFIIMGAIEDYFSSIQKDNEDPDKEFPIPHQYYSFMRELVTDYSKQMKMNIDGFLEKRNHVEISTYITRINDNKYTDGKKEESELAEYVHKYSAIPTCFSIRITEKETSDCIFSACRDNEQSKWTILIDSKNLSQFLFQEKVYVGKVNNGTIVREGMQADSLKDFFDYYREYEACHSITFSEVVNKAEFLRFIAIRTLNNQWFVCYDEIGLKEEFEKSETCTVTGSFQKVRDKALEICSFLNLDSDLNQKVKDKIAQHFDKLKENASSEGLNFRLDK